MRGVRSRGLRRSSQISSTASSSTHRLLAAVPCDLTLMPPARDVAAVVGPPDAAGCSTHAGRAHPYILVHVRGGGGGGGGGGASSATLRLFFFLPAENRTTHVTLLQSAVTVCLSPTISRVKNKENGKRAKSSCKIFNEGDTEWTKFNILSLNMTFMAYRNNKLTGYVSHPHPLA